MNTVSINLAALQSNICEISGWMRDREASWSLVSKVLCGHQPTLNALRAMGVRSFGDSRLENLEALQQHNDELETWYLRLPDASSIPQVVRLADVSLNSEIETITALSAEAMRQQRLHRVIIMIELGDLREGILPGSLLEFYRSVFDLPGIEVLGIGANLGCLSGAVPSVDQMMQLALYRELLELKFGHRLPLVSAGSSAMLPMLLDGSLPKVINHFRIGESVFLGTDIINGGMLPGLNDDVVRLEAEIVEIKEKSLIPSVETSETLSAFEIMDSSELTPGQRGYRALVSVGHLDTDIRGLTPLDDSMRIVGASSDLTVLYIGDERGELNVGDSVGFRLSYSALLGLMNSRYIEKRMTGTPGPVVTAEEEGLVPAVMDNGPEKEQQAAMQYATG